MRFPKAVGITDMKKTNDMIMNAVNLGVNYFDTAWLYPGSEEALGTVLANNGARSRVHIASKLPIYLVRNPGDFDKYFTTSLARLKTGYIDYYLMHMLTDLTSWEKLVQFGIAEWAAEKKAQGKLKQFGFSFHGPRDEFLKILNAYDWDFCQIQYNYSNENYQAGRTGLLAAASKNIPVIIMEPLMGGSLVTRLPAAARNAFARARPDLTPAGWGLNWLWDQSAVTVVLSGMSTAEQVNENLALTENAKAGMLTDADRAVYKEALAAFDAAYKVKCTGCSYCMPCPNEVNIPGCFSSYNTSFALTPIEGFKQYVTSTLSLSTGEYHAASKCIQCGKCESHCPQHINIRNELMRVRKRMEPFYIRAAIAIALKLFGGRRK
ncbi:aldo/keto reductase [Spirochaetia bacterium]|nr:aldo/keto reductase [Spirochaetia bacterium]